MQSSAVVTFRALVMLLCLVLVPLAAIFGSALPQLFNEIARGRVYPEIARPGNEAGDARSRGGDAPIFAGSGQVASGDESSGAARAVVRDAAGSLWAPAAARSNSADSRPGADALHSPAHLPAVRVNVAPSSSYSPAAPGSPAAATRDVPASADQFKRLECRLRDLGVTYYLLETWGTGAARYRFHCKVSVAGNPNHTRPFDATDDDPLRAMQQVVDQVESWRTGAQP